MSRRTEYAVAEFPDQGITYSFVNVEGLWIIERFDLSGRNFSTAKEFKRDVAKFGRPIHQTAQGQW